VTKSNVQDRVSTSGGTFTDFAVWKNEGNGYVEIEEPQGSLARPDYAKGVIRGSRTLSASGIGKRDPVIVVHGTTVSTNAVIERSSRRSRLLTTQGYRDLPHHCATAARQADRSVNRRRDAAGARETVFEVRERLLSDGFCRHAARRELGDDRGARAEARGARHRICLINPTAIGARKRALELVGSGTKSLAAMASHEVWPQQSEYERAMLTLLNVYVKRLMASYIGRDRVIPERKPCPTPCSTSPSRMAASCRRPEGSEFADPHAVVRSAAGVTAAVSLGPLSRRRPHPDAGHGRHIDRRVADRTTAGR